LKNKVKIQIIDSKIVSLNITLFLEAIYFLSKNIFS